MRNLIGLVLLLILGSAVWIASATSSDSVAFPQFSGTERISPVERLSWDDIRLTADGIFIEADGIRLVAIADTNSMDPVLDKESKVLSLKPTSSNQIFVGDIISYKERFGDRIIIHRVVEIGNDGSWYAVTKGDNNAISDGKIRWDQVRSVLVGIIY